MFDSAKEYTTLEDLEIPDEELKMHNLSPKKHCVKVPKENIIWSGWQTEYDYLTRLKQLEMLQKEDSIYDEEESRFERNYEDKFVENKSPVSIVIYFCQESNKIKR